MEKQLKYYLVKGLVQGVGYRAFVCRQATQLKVTGWVRNLKTSDVELLALADSLTHNKLSQALLQGPPGARVEKLQEKLIVKSPKVPTAFDVLETRETPCYEV